MKNQVKDHLEHCQLGKHWVNCFHNVAKVLVAKLHQVRSKKILTDVFLLGINEKGMLKRIIIFVKDIVLNDIVLLPSPDYKKVPHGKVHKMLYAEGFVTSAVEIDSGWNEDEAVRALEAQFTEKLMNILPPR